MSDLLRDRLVRVRVIPVCARAPQRHVEGIEAIVPGRYRVHWAAILVRRHREAMPMDGRFKFQSIGEVDLDVLPFAQFDYRPRGLVGVSP